MAGKFRPLLAATYKEGINIPFPIIGSPKVDGIRGLTPAREHGIFDTSTRALKNIPNTYTRFMTRDYTHLDGEFVVGDPLDPMTWDRTKSEIMTREGEPAFTFYVFDHTLNLDAPFAERLRSLREWAHKFPPHIRVLEQFVLRDIEQLNAFEEHCVTQGWEGAMYRTPDGRYKCGRSTLNESFLVKWKRFERQFGVIVDFVEQMYNGNEAVENELGYAKRSSHAENKVPMNTLGAFVVRNPKWQKTFRIGTGEGLTMALRQHIWDHREEYRGKSLIFEYQVAGSREAPRIPSFKGFAECLQMPQSTS